MHRPSRDPAPASLALVAALAFAACGGSTSSSPTTAPSSAILEPATAAPATEAPATAAPAAPAAVAPSEKLIASDGRLIVHPPGWWTKEDMGIVYVASSEAAASRLVGTSALSPGDVYVQFATNTITPDAVSDPAVHLPAYLSTLLDGLGMTAGAPVTFTAAGKPAARVEASSHGLELIGVTVKEDDGTFADVIAYGAPGEKAALEALVLQMVEGLTYPGS